MLIGINGGYFPAICRVCFFKPATLCLINRKEHYLESGTILLASERSVINYEFYHCLKDLQLSSKILILNSNFLMSRLNRFLVMGLKDVMYKKCTVLASVIFLRIRTISYCNEYASIQYQNRKTDSRMTIKMRIKTRCVPCKPVKSFIRGYFATSCCVSSLC